MCVVFFLQAVAGDVLVGWISDKSGKGGVDDYFLAGDIIKCSDGAESCPDRSKGGTKDIELLNAVSRANYTMLTIRRPVLAQGAYDVDVVLDRPQNIFWSVGYKSAAMRKNHKPIKNVAPMTIEFGRRPSWNCPENFDGKSSHSEDDGFKDHVNEDDESASDINYDMPRRRISSPVILTPSNKGPSTPTPRPGVVFRPVYRSTRRPTPAIVGTPRPNVRHRHPPAKDHADRHLPFNNRPDISKGFDHSRASLPNRQIISQEWQLPNIGCSQTSDGPLYVHLGPATPMRGNQGLKGIAPDGTALYINGLLAPELTLQRGKEYTFVIETGLGTDPKKTFHPFYITDDATGGRKMKTESEARLERVVSGVTLSREGSLVPSAMGKLCVWTSPRPAMTFASFKDFHDNLNLKCEPTPPSMASLLSSTQINNPSILKFVPDNTMPDELFYQSFMAKHLGGKIHLRNYCYDSDVVPRELTTYRPDILKHFAHPHPPINVPSKSLSKRIRPSEVFSPAESRRAPNRRVDFDEDAYDYDVNDFDHELDLYNKCKSKALMRGRSLKNNEDMPSFEHFPKRDIMKTSGISEVMPSDAECEGVLDKPKEIEEKDEVFESLLKSVRRKPLVPSIKLSRGTAKPSHRTTM